METVSIQHPREVRIVRPKDTLVRLIQQDIEDGDNAGIEYYRQAGEKLKEARSQTRRGEWGRWVKEEVGISYNTARTYMALADEFEFREALPGYNGAPNYRTLSEFYTPDRDPGHRPVWHKPVMKAMPGRRETKRYRAPHSDQERERRLRKQLGLKLIIIGYRALASKLHPDGGGTHEAMIRLNAVRDILKGAL